MPLLLRILIGTMLIKVYYVDIIELFENILVDKNFVSDLNFLMIYMISVCTVLCCNR